MRKNIIYEYCEVEDTELKEYIINTPSLQKYFQLSWSVLKTRQYCGILNFNNQDIYLLPKIADSDEKNLDIFIYMLMYAYDIQLQNEDIASCKNETHNILEVFMQLFAQGLIGEFKRGVYKEYITEQENLRTLRGKYLINENLKYNHIKNKIYCEYDEFSQNNTLNQFFLYAIKTLLKYSKNKKLLKQCELALDGVEQRVFNIHNLEIHFNRLNQRYRDSFEFALLLLQKSIPLFSQDKKSFAFLFDMNELFENFIARMIKENYKNVTIPKKNKVFGELYLKPDIIKDDMIIDCKYKKISSSDIAKREDRYQMYVYANNYEMKSTMLLYPKYKDTINKTVFLGENDKKVELKMRSIDLDFDGGYDEFLDTIKRRLEMI